MSDAAKPAAAGAGSGPRGPRAPRAPRAKPEGEKPAAEYGTDAAGTFRVKETTAAKSLSGAISGQAREGADILHVKAIGPASVNQGVKAVIIARGNVSEDGFDFVIRPDLVPAVGPDAVDVSVHKSAKVPEAVVDEANQLRIVNASKPSAVAGAIAGRARSGATVMSASGIGPVAVLKLTKAVAMARSYVTEDGFDIFAVPRFVQVKIADGDRTGVAFDIYVRK